ncbi:uncharacterized protein LOC132621203 isoform X2 [Lycium barbarum]|uniref:uncharacterized protein LOC132621203 isoform X2 n=1 Tax=Lycium barbarum TaxID=112863 RepID=UPI00293ECDDB|nr:uncharacterized protein LOC132621203 isoform X2 [Lycium barbarum]
MEENKNMETHQVDDEDEGPPPGFDSLTLPSQHTNEGPPPGWPHQHNQQQLLQTTDVEMESKEHESEDDEDGPPPGWNTIIPQKNLPSSPPATAAVTCDTETEKKEEVVENEDNGPSLGWQLTPQLPPLQTSEPPSGTQDAPLADTEMENKEDVAEDEDNGPPPGWQLTPQQPLQTSTPPSRTQPALADIEMEKKEEVVEDEDNGPPPGWNLIAQPQPLQISTPPSGPQQALLSEMETDSKQESTKNEEVRPQIEKQPMSHLRQMKPMVPQSSSHAATVSAEMGQMVCGSCRQLLSYPQGAKLVKCSCCRTINLVLEVHDVGQVKCGGCALLLMYPYGAPSVRCSSCRHMTKIGAHNRRPPLSMQQPRRRHPSYQVH